MARHGVVLFHTIHAAFRLEQAARREGIPCKLIPTPRHLSSDCGTALRFDLDKIDLVRGAIEAAELDVQTVCELEP